MVLEDLKQDFPQVTRTISWKFLLKEKFIIKSFLFLRQMFNGGVLLFGNRGNFDVCLSSFGLSAFSASFSSKYIFMLNHSLIITSHFLWIFLSTMKNLDLNFWKNKFLILSFLRFPSHTISMLVFFILTVFKS